MVFFNPGLQVVMANDKEDKSREDAKKVAGSFFLEVVKYLSDDERAALFALIEKGLKRQYLKESAQKKEGKK